MEWEGDWQGKMKALLSSGPEDHLNPMNTAPPLANTLTHKASRVSDLEKGDSIITPSLSG